MTYIYDNHVHNHLLVPTVQPWIPHGYARKCHYTTNHSVDLMTDNCNTQYILAPMFVSGWDDVHPVMLQTNSLMCHRFRSLNNTCPVYANCTRGVIVGIPACASLVKRILPPDNKIMLSPATQTATNMHMTELHACALSH